MDQTPPPRQAAAPLLQPGRNCWRIEKSSRLAFLIDGAAYFSAVRAAIARARRSVFILGWDIDSRVRLVPGGANDGLPEELGDFLNEVVKRQRDLQMYVLTWDFAMVFALDREWLPIYKLDWRTHRRLHFQLDDKHPLGASHHQKIVVVDDAVAFVGGLDLTHHRWDTPEHACRNPGRCDPDGKA
jgi:phospholipase D1/2